MSSWSTPGGDEVRDALHPDPTPGPQAPPPPYDAPAPPPAYGAPYGTPQPPPAYGAPQPPPVYGAPMLPPTDGSPYGAPSITPYGSPYGQPFAAPQPPPLDPYGTPYSVPGPYGQPWAPYGSRPPMTSGWRAGAIVLTVLSGLLTFMACGAGIPSLVLGIIALNRSSTDGASATRMARIGWIVFGVAAAVGAALVVWLLVGAGSGSSPGFEPVEDV